MTDSNQTEPELLEKLKTEIDVTNWPLLEPHFKRDVLIIVSNDLNLAEAGLAVINDNTEKVTDWLSSNLLRKPTLEESEIWRKDPKKTIAEVLIVQPYVLIQLIPENLS